VYANAYQLQNVVRHTMDEHEATSYRMLTELFNNALSLVRARQLSVNRTIDRSIDRATPTIDEMIVLRR